MTSDLDVPDVETKEWNDRDPCHIVIGIRVKCHEVSRSFCR